MIIILINQHDLKVGLLQLVRQFQTTETTAYYNDPFLIILFNVKTHIIIMFYILF